MPAKAPDFPPGSMLPGTKYRIVKQLGAGGMGVVFQVVKPPEIQGVLKLMSSDLAGHHEFRTRFFDEVRVLAQLDHPNIVRVFDYDTLLDATPFYVMELLNGRTVRDVIATMGTVPPRVAFEITRQLCEALHCAHTHEIPVVHRDIKPENIFLHSPRHGEPVVKLIDFGVVAVADRSHDGAFVGTWKYAAPEQIRGERATPATDLYAVGLVLYEMLAGVGPFDHFDSGTLVSQAHLREPPAPVSKFAPWVPASIVALIQSALSKDPAARPRDAYAFAERLYELEWANDGKDAHERTAEGPLSRVLTSVREANAERPKRISQLPTDRLGDVPVVAVPSTVRHQGPTLKGVGTPNEPTSPGEEALLAGLVGSDVGKPPSKREREAHGIAPAVAAPRTHDTDTFASQESDARRPAKPRSGRFAVAIGLAAVAVVAGAGALAWKRGAAREEPRVGATIATPTATELASAIAPSPPPSEPPSPPITSAGAPAAAASPAKTARPPARPSAKSDPSPPRSAPPPAPPAPKGSAGPKPREDFLRGI